jgi:hypothetical protein
MDGDVDANVRHFVAHVVSAFDAVVTVDSELACRRIHHGIGIGFADAAIADLHAVAVDVVGAFEVGAAFGIIGAVSVAVTVTIAVSVAISISVAVSWRVRVACSEDDETR